MGAGELALGGAEDACAVTARSVLRGEDVAATLAKEGSTGRGALEGGKLGGVRAWGGGQSRLRGGDELARVGRGGVS